MRKSLDQILTPLEDAFRKAETDFISNEYAIDEVYTRQQLFVTLLDMFGTWHKKGDCLPSEWIEEVFFSGKPSFYSK